MKRQHIFHVLKHRPLKMKRLRRGTEKILIRRGRKDAENAIVRRCPNGHYYSPFIQQEINLCIAQINMEKEFLERSLMVLQKSVAKRNLLVKTRTEKIDCLNNKKNSPPNISNFDFNENKSDALINSYVNMLQSAEQQNQLERIHRQIENLEVSNIVFQAENEKEMFLCKKEVEITQLRCMQLYELTAARLSAYWNGVLMAKQNDIDYPPAITHGTVFSDIKKEIESISFERWCKNG